MERPVEQLIHEVQKRPVLWNKWHANYKNRILVDTEWSKVAEIVDKPKEEIKSKWRTLRDSFQREIKKIKTPRNGVPNLQQYTGKWIYFDGLSFLMETMWPGDSDAALEVKEEVDTDDDTSSSLNDREGEEEPEEILEAVVKNEPIACLFTAPESETPRKKHAKKRKSSSISDYERQMLRTEERKIRTLAEEAARDWDQDDEEMLFLKSLAPYLRQLSPLRKLLVRNQFQNILIKEISSSATSNFPR